MRGVLERLSLGLSVTVCEVRPCTQGLSDACLLWSGSAGAGVFKKEVVLSSPETRISRSDSSSGDHIRP